MTADKESARAREEKERQARAKPMMYRNILVPIDGTDFSIRAVEHAVKLARAVGARVTFLTVTEPFYLRPAPGRAKAELELRAADLADRILETAAEQARAAGVPFETAHFVGDRPAEAIARAAEEHGCDLIVMASHGRRCLAALVSGSETLRVLQQSGTPLLVLRPRKEKAA